MSLQFPFQDTLTVIFGFFVLCFMQDKKLWHNISAGIINTDQSLVLQGVGRHSAGRYRCMAVNREGETESDTLNLDVKCKSDLLFFLFLLHQ